MIASNQDRVVDFNLYVGNKALKENMGRRGQSGEEGNPLVGWPAWLDSIHRER
jgi:hypothetical protein